MEQKEREEGSKLAVVALIVLIVLALAIIAGNSQEELVTSIKEKSKTFVEETSETLLLRYGPENIRQKLQEANEARFEAARRESREKGKAKAIKWLYGNESPEVATVTIGQHRYKVDPTGEILSEVDETGKILREY